MTITLTDPGNGGLFDILGRACHAIDTLNTARGTTVPDEVEDFVEEWEGLSGADLDYQAMIQNISGASGNWQGAGRSLASAIRQACERLIVEMVVDDAAQPDRSLTPALEYLIDQMGDNGNYVDPNVVTLALAADSGDNDVVICYTTRRGDGRVQENTIAETIDIEVTSEDSTNPGLQFLGDADEAEPLSHNWPMGSGCNRTLIADSAAASLLSNGDFADESTTGIPDTWTIGVGTPNVTIALSDAEIQTVVIAGSPSGGTYHLRWTNADGITRSTVTLDYNASSATVQSALRALPGLELITVAGSGATPNFTHTVTFTGVAGDLSEMTSLNNMIGGATITHATTAEGDDGAFKGRALQFISNGNGEQTAIYAPLSGLDRETVYFVHFRLKRVTPEEESTSSSSSSSSSTSTASSSSSQSNSSSSTVASMTSSASTSSTVASSTSSESTSSTVASSTSTESSSSSVASSTSSESSSSSVASSTSSPSSASSSESSISTSSSTSSSIASETSSSSASGSSSSSETAHELRVEIVDGIGGSRTTDGEGDDNEIRIDLDHLGETHSSHWFSFRLQRTVADPVYLRIRILTQLAALETVYFDEMAIAEGVELYDGGPFVAAFSGINDAILGDAWILTSTNDRAGAWQEWYNRLFAMAAKGLLLPSSGSVNVPDALIG